MNYTIIQNFISKNRSKEVLVPVGMVVHETATSGASDEAEQSYFNTNDLKASVHAFVDYNSITQCVPFNEVAWGSGQTSNHKFIQVELCHFDGDKFIEVWNRGVWLFAYCFVNLLKINTITKDNLMSHAEVSAKWKETNHTDPVQYFADNGKTVDQFRSAVQAEIKNQLGSSDNTKFFNTLNTLVNDKVITSPPDYWKNSAINNTDVRGDWMGIVITKMTNISDLGKAIQYLADLKITGSPAYWVANCVAGKTCNIDYVKTLIINGVSKLRL
jgi:N-acetylmuramoyl-L-alanine amidase CwlA